MNILINSCLLCYLLLNNIQSTYCSKADEKDIEKQTHVIVKKSCCPKDFLLLVLTKWEECMRINQWEFTEDPNVVCRRDMFNKDGPCNVERIAKCNDRKDEWLECIHVVTEKNKGKLKAEFQNNDKKIKELPKEKLLCYQRALADVKCE